MAAPKPSSSNQASPPPKSPARAPRSPISLPEAGGNTVDLGMGGGPSRSFHLCALVLLLLLLWTHECCCIAVRREADELLPYISPNVVPTPMFPIVAPSPMAPFTNSTIPRLSGHCDLNFTALSSMMTVTSTNCMAAFAPFLANVVCCPQVKATLVILMGQSSKHTNTLSLNTTVAAYCLSDFEQILVGQGANDSVPKICSVHSSNLTAGSCPVSDVTEFESTVDTQTLLAACGKIDSANECCEQTCQNAILDASRKLSEKAYSLLSIDGGSHVLSDHSTRIDDCKDIVLRWLGSKLEISSAKEVLRGLSNCRINKVCPLSFPSLRHVIQGCGAGESNQTACCSSVDSYVSHLQKQSFVTNLQALNCAASLGVKLQKANITENLYTQCHISLKDFSLQVGTQKWGCLLPSLPSDVVLDTTAGVSFLCDLNDNIPAPWPVTSQLPASCNKTVRIPALPDAASEQSSSKITGVRYLPCLIVFAALSVVI